MNANHRNFFEQPEGRALQRVLTREELIPQYELLSRLDLPAVQAVVWELEPLLEALDPKTRNFAIQSSGALIGQVLSSRGYRVARDRRGEKKRGRIRKSRFIKTGTVWEPSATDGQPHEDRVNAIMNDLMIEYRDTLQALAR